MTNSVRKLSFIATALAGLGTLAWAADSAAPGSSPAVTSTAAAATADEAFPFPRLAKRFAALGITSSQREQVRTILKDAKPQLGPMIQDLVRKKAALRQLIQTSPVNEQAIRDQQSRVSAIEANFAVQRAYIFQKISGVLTPTQLQQIKTAQAAAQQRAAEGLMKLGRWIDGE